MKSGPACPVCQSDQLREIFYSFPDFSTFDLKKYEIGGCCITNNEPKYKCQGCWSSWSG